MQQGANCELKSHPEPIQVSPILYSPLPWAALRAISLAEGLLRAPPAFRNPKPSQARFVLVLTAQNRAAGGPCGAALPNVNRGWIPGWIRREGGFWGRRKSGRFGALQGKITGQALNAGCVLVLPGVVWECFYY